MYCYSNNFRVGPKQKYHDRILSIRRISDFWKSAKFRRIRICHTPTEKATRQHWDGWMVRFLCQWWSNMFV